MLLRGLSGGHFHQAVPFLATSRNDGEMALLQAGTRKALDEGGRSRCAMAAHVDGLLSFRRVGDVLNSEKTGRAKQSARGEREA